MIDLSKRKQELYKIKLEDGTILKLKKPTQAMLITMIDLSQEREDENEVLKGVFDVLTKVFNRNTDNRVFSQEEITEMLDLEIAMEILKDYLNSTLTALGK